MNSISLSNHEMPVLDSTVISIGELVVLALFIFIKYLFSLPEDFAVSLADGIFYVGISLSIGIWRRIFDVARH